MKTVDNNRGFSMLEVIIAVVVGMLIIASLHAAFTGSLKVFKNVKAISDNVVTKTPSIELVARYFDRWGVGVPSKQRWNSSTSAYVDVMGTTCANCPNYDKMLTITTTNGYSDISFYGNLYGFGVVQAVVNTTTTGTRVFSCRLNALQSPTNHNIYTIWRSDTPLNDKDGSNNIIPLGLNNLSVNNQDCSQVTVGTTYNVTMDDEAAPWSGSIWKTVQAGDIIQRMPHLIRIYVASNSTDNNQLWLYADLTDSFSPVDADNEAATPIAPVNSFSVTALPSGCNAAGGQCTAVQADFVFRSQTKNYQGQYDTYSVRRVFGR